MARGLTRAILNDAAPVRGIPRVAFSDLRNCHRSRIERPNQENVESVKVGEDPLGAIGSEG